MAAEEEEEEEFGKLTGSFDVALLFLIEQLHQVDSVAGAGHQQSCGHQDSEGQT